MTNITKKLFEVIAQAEAIGIPVSKRIEETVIINKRAKTRFGCCKKYKDKYIIEVSEAVANGPEASLLQILAHEILHTCKGCQNHSLVWKTYAGYMNKIYGYNIKRTVSAEELGIKREETKKSLNPARYIFVCKGCGQRIERIRKSKLVTHTQHYRCRCGGKIEREV